MFYLQTADGERFFTDARSDDVKEFSKIIEAKLGRDASELFETLISEAQADQENIMDILIALLVGALLFVLGMAFQLRLDTKDINIVLEDNKKLNDRIKQLKEENAQKKEETIEVIEIHDMRTIFKGQ